MTRKDYVTIAAALKNAKPERECTEDKGTVVWLACVASIADRLYRDNPRFRFDTFLTACGVMRD